MGVFSKYKRSPLRKVTLEVRARSEGTSQGGKAAHAQGNVQQGIARGNDTKSGKPSSLPEERDKLAKTYKTRSPAAGKGLNENPGKTKRGTRNPDRPT